MAKAKTADEIVQDLVLIVKQKREEIKKAERPNWITNGSFKYAKGSAESFNLQTITDVNVFFHMQFSLRLVISNLTLFDFCRPIQNQQPHKPPWPFSLSI